jgi:hypothetical protein
VRKIVPQKAAQRRDETISHGHSAGSSFTKLYLHNTTAGVLLYDVTYIM